MPVRGLLYLRLAEPLTDAAMDNLRSRFVADLVLEPNDDLMAPWIPLQLFEYPQCLPGPLAHWYEANLAKSYYGLGYERGDLPLFLRCAEWLEAAVPRGEVWHGNDSTDESVCPFGAEARAELLAYYERVGHEPYVSRHRQH
ncbi:hypothetical protein [Zavarzinella formosa]|uniref:hypothetical protein n=1 Tax=Zavarzinella formosa TaxID=360055 RepID=UPI000375A2E0|nr:hypothetical protein [Zavarzinella formosa]